MNCNICPTADISTYIKLYVLTSRSQKICLALDESTLSGHIVIVCLKLCTLAEHALSLTMSVPKIESLV